MDTRRLNDKIWFMEKVLVLRRANLVNKTRSLSQTLCVVSRPQTFSTCRNLLVFLFSFSGKDSLRPVGSTSSVVRQPSRFPGEPVEQSGTRFGNIFEVS